MHPAARLAAALVVKSVGLALLGGASGCQRDPLDRAVTADTRVAFDQWQARLGAGGAETRRQFGEAVQEIRLAAMGEREVKRAMGEPAASGTEEIEQALRKRIHGRPVREVLQLGYELRVWRLRTELFGLEEAMAKNALLTTRPGDVDSKRHLDGLRERQAARVANYRADLAAAERELAPLQAASGRVLLPPQEGLVFSLEHVDTKPARTR